jgi:succinate dehydrogenase / fumarate reductase iron-sulfur subunit
MRINGQARLACKTSIRSLADEAEEITVEPAGNMPTIKDLVADMAPFWDKVRAVKPWLQPGGPPPEREYLVPNEAMQALGEVMNCIMCGACVSDCTSLEVDKTFLGPAALAKAWRFVGDPRDDTQLPRLREYSEPSGMWDCTRCNMCVQVCPKDVKPMDQILKLRSEAVHAGIKDNAGSRHTIAFIDIIERGGRLDEFELPILTHGELNLAGQISDLPVAARMIRTGKMPSPFHKPIGGIKHVKRIFEHMGHKTPISAMGWALGQAKTAFLMGIRVPRNAMMGFLVRLSRGGNI